MALMVLGVPVGAIARGALLSPRGLLPIRPAPIHGLRQALADRPDPVSRAVVGKPAASIPSGAWQPLGPAPIGPPFLAGGGFYGGVNSGRVTGLVVISAGALAGRVVVGTAGGGIWTSDDGGTVWTPRTDAVADLAIGSVTVDPSNANHLIAGTGEANQSGDCFPGAGILASTDGGTSWALQNPGGVFTGLDVAEVAIDPSDSNHQFAATNGGLYVTSNGGTSWAKPADPSYGSVDGNITAVVIDPTTTANVYIGGGAATVAKSADGGTTWGAANAGIASPGSFAFTALAMADSSPSTLYASIGSFNNAVAVYKSTSGASSWSHLTATPDFTGQAYAYGGGSGEQGWYDNVLAIDPTNANHVLAGGISLVETTTGGSSWGDVNGQSFFGGGTNKIHPDQHALAFAADGTVWVGDDGGMYHYTPSSGAVVNANGNLNITQFYYGFNEVGGALVAGSQDNGTATTSSSSLAAWTGVFSGDGGPSAITPNQPATQFIQANQHLYVTTDGFASSLTDITPPALGLFTPPMIVVPNTGSPSSPTVFYGGPDLYRTTNPTSGSPTWTQVTAVGSSFVTAIAASPTNSQVVYVGFEDGTIEVSTDGGVTFSPVAAVSTPETFVTGLSVDPSNPDAVTASFSYNDTRYRIGLPHVQQYVWSASPGSGTWTTITGSGLPAAVSRVVYDNGALVAATDAGVYATSAPAGSSTVWTAVGAGLPNVQVQDLYVDSSGLYIVTHGRGAWLLSSRPQNVLPPTISGTAQQGQTLNEVHGQWTNSPTSYAYQWEDCDSSGNACSAIAGATGQTYTLIASDAGHTIRVRESATNAGGTGGPSTSAQTAVVVPLPPANSSPPTISGNTTQGQTLTEMPGSWANSPTSYSYQWEDCDSSGSSCSAIGGATSQSYTLAASDVGHTIRVQESATNAGGTGGPVASATTAVVAGLSAPPSAPLNSSPPTISGSATIGQMVSASTGAWSGTPPISYAYQWERCNPGCSSIAGATSSSYALTGSDLGAKVQAVVTASNSVGSAQATSAQVGPVAPTSGAIKSLLAKILAPRGKLAKIGAILKHGGFTLSFKALSAGKLTISWYLVPKGAQLSAAKPTLVATGKKSFTKAGTVKITIKPTTKGKTLLKNAKKLKLTAKGAYTPKGAKATSATKRFTLKR
jgi:hypothetical protein